MEGLHDEARPGRPRNYNDENVATVIDRALNAKPDEDGPWSVRRIASSEGVSKSTVQRWFALSGINPHPAPAPGARGKRPGQPPGGRA